MSYYDIDAILTESEKIPCTFEIDVPDLGYLDNNPSHVLQAGTRIGLPLWLAEMLALSHHGRDEEAATGSRAAVSVTLPGSLGDEVVQALKADARAVPLRDQSAYFYGLAARLLDLFDERELGAVLRRAYVSRAAEIARHAKRAGGGGGGEDGSRLAAGAAADEFARGLEEWERGLFRQVHDGARAARAWMDSVKR